jgi:AbrB family looped-hinge helix DNA binding protein
MKSNDSDSMVFYGSVKVGERGQVVIPADARDKLGIKPGDKLLAFQASYGKGIILTTSEEFENHMRRMNERLTKLQKQVKK